jgi:disulfide bond formation protein DsbB
MLSWIVNWICIIGIAGLIGSGFVIMVCAAYCALKTTYIAVRSAVKWIYKPPVKDCYHCNDYSLIKHWCKKHDVFMDPDEECAETQKGE